MDRDLIYRYFRGDASEEEEIKLLDWVEESKENRETFNRERMLFDIALFSSHEDAKAKRIKFRSILRWSYRVAAVIIVLFSVNVLVGEYITKQAPTIQTITAPEGQHTKLSLADGTEVWLNSNSKLTYTTSFNSKERVVKLDGEAYFNVAHNKKVPFFVKTERNIIKVVGTSFNVRAYRGSNLFETRLIDGVVDIYKADGSTKLTRLKKSEFFGDYGNDKYAKRVITDNDYLMWKEGIYSFNNELFANIISKLRNYYDVEITLNNPTALNYRYTGKFKSQDGIEHILKVMQKVNKFYYTISEDKKEILITRYKPKGLQ